MQGLILAAGMGKRLGKYTEEQTKCMVKINGKTLIEYTLDALCETKISKVIIVVGYEGNKLKSFIGDSYKNLKIVYIENTVYYKTNNIYSLWLASKHLIEDDTLLLESDLIFDKKILEDILNNINPNLVLVAKFESWMDGTVTILDENEDILNFVPKENFNWDNIEKYYKVVNIYKFSKEFSKNCYIPFLADYIKTLGENEHYEQVLRVISYLDNINLKTYKLTTEKWYEIDDMQDLDIASTLFSENETELSLYQKRYGGYWRFTKLKDFCYLVNPYFPNKFLMDELKSKFEILISEYPSGLNTENLLASNLFGCDSSEIVLGNGSAELIRAVMKSLDGYIGIICPTFNEYAESAGYSRVKKLIIDDKNFNYSIDKLKEFSLGVNSIVLINPDNPSGHCFTKDEILDLLDYLNNKNKYIILDESFIDFSGDNLEFSLIDSPLLKKYKNLIVIKSIGKSYGVPGLRLGVLASGDTELLSKIKALLPIWNINSFGEYFLQIIGKYKSDYKTACKKISEERDRFFIELSKINFLRVIPSKSNYFLCELTEKYTATDLTKLLLNKHQVFIKDCTGKIGFENKNYVRITVKDVNDNDFLIKTLKKLINV